MKQLQQVSKEIQEFQNELQKNPQNIENELTNSMLKENEFPPPFDKITDTWIKHTMSASTIMKFACNVIDSTRKDILDQIDKIYKTGKDLTGPYWPLTVYRCSETNIRLRESGVMNKPGQFYLEYEIVFFDKAAWTIDNTLLVGGTHVSYMNKHSYKLGVASPHKRNVHVIRFSGWIMDNSKDPPIQLPLNRVKVLEQEIIDIGVQVPSYRGYTLILPENIVEDKNDKYKIGTITSYRMILPYQIVRFYSDLNTELFVENTDLVVDLTSTLNENFSPQEIQTIFQQNSFIKKYSATGITQNLEIGVPSMDCDNQISSTNGAIILSGDCIDHGGYVIASNTSITVNGKPAARIGDKVFCIKHGNTEIIASVTNRVISNKKQIARIGDKTKCGAQILGGSTNTFAGDK
jgi:uncharacterized Zn-binding protein involved in type VI secretion